VTGAYWPLFAVITTANYLRTICILLLAAMFVQTFSKQVSYCTRLLNYTTGASPVAYQCGCGDRWSSLAAASVRYHTAMADCLLSSPNLHDLCRTNRKPSSHKPNSTSPVSPKSSVACPPHSITSHYSKRQLDRFRRFCTTDVAFPYTLHLIAPFHFTTKFTCTGKSPTIYTGVSGMSSTCYEEVGDKLATSYGLVTGKLWGNWSSGIWPISACIFTPAA